jgi:hypothetical protein
MCPSIHVFTCGFKMASLHHVTALKVISFCPKIILDAGLFMEVELRVLGLHTHLTRFLLIFLWRYLKTKVCATTLSVEKNRGFRFNNLQVKSYIQKLQTPAGFIFMRT